MPPWVVVVQRGLVARGASNDETNEDSIKQNLLQYQTSCKHSSDSMLIVIVKSFPLHLVAHFFDFYHVIACRLQ